ncbi:MAG TPA: hypothetical protein VGR85_07165 [Candidatus Limnocylindria bacterium]|jgi:hypothetical protein|nr:hypothetical protein [Candidatus Limnocylindria bacterium]
MGTRWLLAMVVLAQCSPVAPGPAPSGAVASPSGTPPANATIETAPWPAVVTPAILGGPNCRPPSQLVSITSGGGPRPLLGTPQTGTETRAVLAFFLVPMAGVEQKMILRINGTGALVIQAQHDDGTRIAANGVDSGHISSSYDPIFPGTTEYGVLMTFPKSGCWQVHVQRTGAAADFYVIVG